MPFAPLDPQIEHQLLVIMIETLVIPFEPLDVTQIQTSKTEAPVAMVVDQSEQTSGHFIVLTIELAVVAVARLADAKRFAGNTTTRVSFLVRSLGHPPSTRWPHHFF